MDLSAAIKPEQRSLKKSCVSCKGIERVRGAAKVLDLAGPFLFSLCGITGKMVFTLRPPLPIRFEEA